MYDFEPGILARLPSSGRDSASARMARAPRSGLRVDAASCGSLEPGILARLPSSGMAYAFARMTALSAFSFSIDAASCGSHKEAGDANRRRHPAGCLCGDPDGGRVCFSRPSGPQGIAQHRRHPAAYPLCAMGHSGAGRPCPAPSPSDRVPPSRGCDRVRVRDLLSDAPLTPSRGGQWRIGPLGCPMRELRRQGRRRSDRPSRDP